MERRNDKGKEIVKVEDRVHLPEDMQGEIMERLPINSIARLRFASQSWFKHIAHKNFNRNFSARSVEKPLLLFSSCEQKLPGTFSRWFQSVIQETLPKPVNQHEVDLPSLVTNSSVFMCEPVHGLVCCYNGGQNVMICNPGAGTFAELPRITSSGTEDILTECVLGFDTEHELFKVLCATTGLGNEYVDRKFHIFTLGGDENIWRPISCPYSHKPLAEGIHIDGVVYYLAKATETGIQFVMRFDVQKETYAVINITPEIDAAVETYKKRMLMNYNNQLAIVGDCGMSFDIWVLNDGLNLAWSKQHMRIESWDELAGSSAYYCMGSIGTTLLFAPVIVLKGQVHVLSYHLKGEKLEKIGIQTGGDRGNSFLDAYLNQVESPLLISTKPPK